jgi:glycosyltransferase involved in cell wall biosynthesis
MHHSQPQPRIALLGLISKHAGRNRGGTAVNIVRLANGLSARGLGVDVLMRRPPTDSSLPESFDAHVRPHFLSARHRPVLFMQLLVYLLRNRPRALLTFDSRANLLGCAARPFCERTMLWFPNIHNTVEGESHDTGAANRGRRYRRLRKVYRHCDGVITISAGLADEFGRATRLGREKIVVIPPPVVTKRLEHLAASASPCDGFRPQAGSRIIAVGRLTRQKDFATLIRAFALVRRQRPCQLLILGEGELRNELERQIVEGGLADDVSMRGFCANPFPLMAQADVLVVSSRSEGLSSVLIEALALGTPVVATDCPSGPREILQGGHYGELVTVGDDEELARAIGRTLDHPRESAELRAAAEPYRERRVIEQFMHLLEAGIGRPHPALSR